MAKKRRYAKPRRGLLASLVHALLSLIDWLCEGISGAFVALLRGLFKLLMGIARFVLRAVWLVIRVLLWPIGRLHRLIVGRNNRASRCLRLTGEEFEAYMAQVLRDNGFRHVEQTPFSGDQGIDLLAVRSGVTYAIQCKNYADAVGNFAVQEAYTGAQYYGCDEAVVVCPGVFTRAARELAESTDVILWDGEMLSHMMKISGRKPKHRK